MIAFEILSFLCKESQYYIYLYNLAILIFYAKHDDIMK